MKAFLKAVIKTGGGTLASILLKIVSVKIVAILLGPQGIGLLSLLKQILETSAKAGSIGGQTGLIQGSASRKETERMKYLATGLWIFLISSVVAVIGLISVSDRIASLILNSGEPGSVALIRWLAVALFLNIMLIYINALLNGFRAIGRMAMVQVAGAFSMAILAYPAAMLASIGYTKAFVFLLVAGLIASLSLGLIFIHRAGWLVSLLSAMRTRPSWEDMRHFFSFARVSLITGLAITGTLLAVRGLTLDYGGFKAAGIFDASWTFCMIYMTLLLSSFETYYLPTLSREIDQNKRNLLVHQVLRGSLTLVVPLIVAAITLKPMIIHLLYTSDFDPSLQIIRWMLIGSYLKATAWCFGIVLLATANLKVFLWKEIILSAWFFGFSFLAIKYFLDMQFIGVGLLSASILNVAFLIYYMKRRYQINVWLQHYRQWLLGLAVILAASWLTWEDSQVNWLVAIVCMGVAVFSSILSMTPAERAKVIQLIKCRIS